jgi:hypothetical protein
MDHKQAYILSITEWNWKPTLAHYGLSSVLWRQQTQPPYFSFQVHKPLVENKPSFFFALVSARVAPGLIGELVPVGATNQD